MPTQEAKAPSAKDASQLIDLIISRLSEQEKGDFALGLLDAVRKSDPAIQEFFESWLMTAMLRSHPDYERQVKEFRNLEQSGDLYKGVDQRT